MSRDSDVRHCGSCHAGSLPVDLAEPGVGNEESRRHEWHSRLRLEPFRRAAPRPVLGTLDQSSAQRASLDVAARAEQVGRLSEYVDLEATAAGSSMPGRSPDAAPAHVMGSGYPSHEFRELTWVGGASNEVPVIRHDAVRNQPHRVAMEAVAENREKCAIVRRPQEEGRAASCVVDGVKEVGVDGLPMGLRHAVASLCPKRAPCPSKVDAHAPWARVIRTVADQ